MRDNRWGLNRSQRMQLKALICVLGLLLIVILLLGKLILMLVHREEEQDEIPEPEPHIPVVRELTNVWITEVDEEGLSLFRDGNSERYPWGTLDAEVAGPVQLYRADSSVREQVADVVLTDGAVTSVRGALLPSAGTPADPQPVLLSAAGALNAFQQMRRESVAVASSVAETRLCYELVSSGASMSLVPAWQIVTDTTNYYVNCSTGSVTSG